VNEVCHYKLKNKELENNVAYYKEMVSVLKINDELLQAKIFSVDNPYLEKKPQNQSQGANTVFGEELDDESRIRNAFSRNQNPYLAQPAPNFNLSGLISEKIDRELKMREGRFGFDYSSDARFDSKP